MSKLGDAVVADLQRRRKVIGKERVEKVLTDGGVSSTASLGVPAQLRVRHLQVTGTRVFQQGEGKDATTVAEPIDLDWTPRDGVNGVGSEQNLRGKSSVVHFATWALTGRSHLQADVASWVDHVAAEIHVDAVALFVDFDVVKGVPSGTVEVEAGSRRTEIGRFTSHDEFESVMGSVMLGRLRLEVIPVFTADGTATTHTWPTYASSLTVRADQLDPILGPENTLKTRMLQMFVGTSWAAMDAQITRALNALKFERSAEDQVRTTASSVSEVTLGLAEDRLVKAKAAVAKFDPAEPDVDAVFALAGVASERGRTSRELELQLMTGDAAFIQVRSQLRAEERQQRAVEEDAVAQLLFNGMKPTACPRCSMEVTAERYEAEVSEHHCSLCASTLDLRTPADPADPDDGDSDDIEEPQDVVAALQAAVDEAAQGVEELRTAYREAEDARVAAEGEAQAAHDSLDRARARTLATQELIAAQAALDALEALGRPADGDPEPPRPAADEQLLVLRTASALVKEWVKRDQDPMLSKVSDAIADLARRFGITNLSSVSLKGNGNMDVDKGGAETTYSGLTNGEKLRIKLATAIALVQVGHRDGVGRHPGLLFVDSPAAEEIPEPVLRTMLEAMKKVADQTDLQIVVATTHAAMLSDVLDADHLLVATGDNYVW